MSWILNNRTHTAILHIKYATLLKTDLWCYDRVFQCPLSTWFSWCSVLLQKFPGSGQSTAGHDVPQSRIEGRYSIRRRARNSSSLNQSSLYWRSLKRIPQIFTPTKCHWPWLLISPWYNYYISQITFTVTPNCLKTWKAFLQQLCFKEIRVLLKKKENRSTEKCAYFDSFYWHFKGLKSEITCMYF